ncbi:protein-L-isoaspartate O-methyltransferase [Lampropedia cohaerens]|uniref:Protein-L-isoaspartate O-methyltransferase n=1 Tax=Lampropedia cohaerens TaxID=1610491 RepID=A0A0U1Q0H0_9BURK|nr:protein-L-isoaspartate O-methyltransferase [Lampropedia cohaerens]
MRGPVSSAAASVMVPAGLAQASAPTATAVGALPTLAGGRLVDVTGQQGARERMVQRLRGLQGLHPAVIAAMRDVPRHLFVDSALVGKAYEENSLPIGFGQTISKPAVVARMLSLIMETVGSAHAERITGRVLEIGTGCGYQAMVMSRLADEVYSIERLRGLHDRARANLRPMRVANLHLLFGDGMAGYARGAPYAAIVSAAGGDAIPQAWVEQLAVGGRIVAPTATAQGHQVLVVVDKTPTGVRQQTLEGVHFVPLKSGVD